MSTNNSRGNRGGCGGRGLGRGRGSGGNHDNRSSQANTWSPLPPTPNLASEVGFLYFFIRCCGNDVLTLLQADFPPLGAAAAGMSGLTTGMSTMNVGNRYVHSLFL